MNFGDRRDSHYSLLNNNKHKNQHLQRAWNKYGSENFEFIILHELNDNEDINMLEIYYIEKYKRLGLAYNIASGGEGGSNLGKHLSEETKRKIGVKNKENMAGFVMPEETKRKISEEHKKAWNKMSDEEKKKHIEPLIKYNASIKGKKVSEEIRKKIIQRERTHSNAAKYDIEDVREIRRLHEKENKGYAEISKILNIPRHTVYLIATYRRWKYVS